MKTISIEDILMTSNISIITAVILILELLTNVLPAEYSFFGVEGGNVIGFRILLWLVKSK